MKISIRSLYFILCLNLGTAAISAEEGEEYTIQGFFFDRPDNTILQVEMVGVRMVFKLLDENYEAIENVFTHGVSIVDPRGGSRERIVIRPTGDGMSLQGVKTIRKPHLLQVSARLFKGEEDTTGEVFTFFYNQHRVEEHTVTPKPDS